MTITLTPGALTLALVIALAAAPIVVSIVREPATDYDLTNGLLFIVCWPAALAVLAGWAIGRFL